LFGYDYFIAYRSADGKSYARALHAELTTKGNDLHCFLDVKYYGAGSSLPWMQRRALKSTTRLIVIASPEAHLPSSVHMLNEVGQFRRLHPKGKIVPIGVQATLDEKFLPTSRLIKLIPHLPADICVLEEDEKAFPAIAPSDTTIQKLLNDFTEERRGVTRRRWLGYLSLLLASLLVLAVAGAVGFYYQWKRADLESRMALSKGLALEARNSADASPLYSISIAAEAVKQHPTPEAVKVLGTLLGRNRQVVATCNDATGNPSLIAREVAGGKEVFLYACKEGLREWLPAEQTGRIVPTGKIDGPIASHPDGKGVVEAIADGLFLIGEDGTRKKIATGDGNGWPYDLVTGNSGGTAWAAWFTGNQVLQMASLEGKENPRSKSWPEVDSIDALTAAGNSGNLLMATRRTMNPSAEIQEWLCEIRQVNPADGKEVPDTIEIKDDRIDSLASNRDGTLIAAMSSTRLHLVDRLKNNSIKTIPRKGYGTNRTALAMSGDGNWLANAGRDKGIVELRDLRSRAMAELFEPEPKPLLYFSTGSDVMALRFSASGSLLTALCDDYSIWCWQLGQPETGQTLTAEENHGWNLALVEEAPGTTSVISALEDGAAIFTPPYRLDDENTSPSRILMGKSWIERNRDPFRRSFFPRSDSLRTRVARLTDGKSIVISPGGKGIRYLPGCREEQTVAAETEVVDFLTAAAKSPWIASASGNSIALREIPGTDNPRKLETQGRISSLALAPDGSLVAIGREDGVLELRDTGSGTIQAEWKAQAIPAGMGRVPSPSIHGLAWDSSGKRIAWASGSMLYVSRKSKLTTADMSLQLPGTVGPIAWHPGDKWIACGIRKGNIMVLDPASLQKLRELPRSELGNAETLAFSESGDLLAVGEKSGTTIRLWDTDEFTPEGMLRRAQAILGRNLSAREWNDNIGGIKPYQKTFTSLPAGEGVDK